MVNQRTVAVAPGVELSVLVRDARPDTRAFVLVHGLASNARLWDGVGSCLAELGHASVAVDQRGHGSSSKPDHGYDFETVTDDLAAVIEQALGRPAVLAGQSWGGNVVVEFARHVAGLDKANSTEFDLFTEAPGIDYMPDQRDIDDNR